MRGRWLVPFLLAALCSTTGPTASTQAARFPGVTSANWSGYALVGRFKSVDGTFVVPTIKPSCGKWMSAWVGIDGAVNYDLLQAGIAETGCPGQVEVWAWWELLPASSTTITGLKVKPGDQMSVAINRIGAWRWEVYLADDTTGQFYDHTFAYEGPATSAEWVVEAPEIGFFVAALANYGTETFSALDACCHAGLLDRVTMKQGVIVSYATKRATTDDLMAQGFVAHYK